MSIVNLSQFNLKSLKKVLFSKYLIIGDVHKIDNMYNWSKHLMLMGVFANIVIDLTGS